MAEANFFPSRSRVSSGQSLVEVMVALSILTAGFLGILSLLAQSIFLSRTVSDETTATYLAAEGIEIAKNLVDHDIYGVGWGKGALDPCFLNGGDFQLDYTTKDCALLKPFSNDYLYFDPAAHLYVYAYDDVNPAVPTRFTRLVRVKPNPTGSNANEISVQSIVSWSTGLFASHSIDLEDHFYNWHP